MYRNKKENVSYKSNKRRNQNLGKRTDALSEIQRTIDKIDNLIRVKTQKLQYREKSSKKAIDQVNVLKNLRYKLRGAYHRTFLAHTAKWETIRQEIQGEFNQAISAIETL